MITKLLGLLDILAGIWMLLLHYDLGSLRMGFLLGISLMVKGYVFKGNWASYLDMLAGFYLLISLLSTNWLLSYAFAIYLIQKALFSIFG